MFHQHGIASVKDLNTNNLKGLNFSAIFHIPIIVRVVFILSGEAILEINLKAANNAFSLCCSAITFNIKNTNKLISY